MPNLPPPDTVARMVAALDAEPRLAAIGCRIVTPRRRSGRPVILGLSRQPAALCGGVFRRRHLCRCRPRDPPDGMGAGRRLRFQAVLLLGGIRFLPARHRPGLARPLPRRHRHPPQGLRRTTGRLDRRRAGSTSSATASTSSANWVAAGLRLVPRTCGYLLKGLRNGLLGQTAAAAIMTVSATWRDRVPRVRSGPSVAGADAARRNVLPVAATTARTGDRCCAASRGEVFCPDRPAARRCLNSKAMTTGCRSGSAAPAGAGW